MFLPARVDMNIFILKNNRTAILLLTCIFFLCHSSAFAFKNIRKVKSLEIQGIKNLSKHDILHNVTTKSEDDGIIIDVDSLKTALDNNLMIKGYRILYDGDKIKIVVAEKVPAFLLGVKKNFNIYLFELDSSFRMISYKRVYSPDRPLVIVPNEDVQNGALSDRLKKFLELLLNIQKSEVSLYREMSQIDLRDFSKAVIVFRGRKTKFFLYPDYNNFYRLNYFLGYLDRTGYYPNTVRLLNDFAVVR